MSTELKRKAAAAALEYVEDGMKLGIGSGSTSEQFIDLLGEKVKQGLKITGVPTSERSAELCRSLSIPLTDLDDTPHLDLTIDGADEVDPKLSLIKGGGGAHLREKIVASASDKMIVIVDKSKIVDCLGAFALPIEVMPFGLGATRRHVQKICEEFGMQGTLSMRKSKEGADYVTDGGHLIIDAAFGRISDVEGLNTALLAIPGVVETGLFINIATLVVSADPDGVKVIKPV